LESFSCRTGRTALTYVTLRTASWPSLFRLPRYTTSLFTTCWLKPQQRASTGPASNCASLELTSNLPQDMFGFWSDILSSKQQSGQNGRGFSPIMVVGDQTITSSSERRHVVNDDLLQLQWVCQVTVVSDDQLLLL